eukprot:g28686.t1
MWSSYMQFFEEEQEKESREKQALLESLEAKKRALQAAAAAAAAAAEMSHSSQSRGYDAATLAQMAEALPYSKGTHGHPLRCAEACKYVRRKGGCRDGPNCPKCHYCQWRRDGVKNTRAEQDTDGIIEADMNVHPPGLLLGPPDEDEEEYAETRFYLPFPRFVKLQEPGERKLPGGCFMRLLPPL